MTLGPAFFFSPHQDDDTLSMGASIVQHVRAGRSVKVVLMTNGAASNVASKWPTSADFIAERDAEFTAAVTRMGATPIIRSDRMVDNTLTVAYAKGVMQEYISANPTGSFKTMSETDGHPDHARCGQALRQTGVVDARFYIKRLEQGLVKANSSYTAYENIREVFLDYAPVGWLSVPDEFMAGFLRTRNKIYK